MNMNNLGPEDMARTMHKVTGVQQSHVSCLCFRGHDVLVVGASAHMQFFKQAAARHSSNTTAEALRYLEIDLAAAAQGRKHVGRQVKPGQVTQQRFTGVPDLLGTPVRCAVAVS